jgi:glycosyltransferase involved in cell wall biosynthesis
MLNSPEKARRFAYLIPAFPGPTHTFFQRELNALAELGVEPVVVSTRAPQRSLMLHSWAKERAARTEYLWPFSPAPAARAVATLAAAGPARLLRCLRATLLSEKLTPSERASQAALLLPAARLLAWMRDNELPHVHAQFSASSATVAMLAHLLGGVTYSIGAHCDLGLTGGNQRAKWRRASFGIAITDTMRADIRRELGDAAPALFEIAPMGVDFDFFRREAPYQPWEPGAGAFRIFSCGRLNPAKGYGDLIRAVADLAAQGVRATLSIAGPDLTPDQGHLRAFEALAKSLGVREHVVFLGGAAEERIRAELEKAHAFALASWEEGLGVATMEAMAMEVPAVATRVGGVPELIDSGEHGLLVPAHDPAALATALRRLRDDPALCKCLGQAGRARVTARYDTRRSARVLLDLVSRVAPP